MQLTGDEEISGGMVGNNGEVPVLISRKM